MGLDLEHHQQEELAFSTLVDCLCLWWAAGRVRARVDEIKYELAAEGTELKQKIVYMLTVKVTEERELALL